jgi:hypothetical protein
MMKIFLDDIRFPREATNRGWTIVRNYDDFLWTWALNKHEITEISFDHDLGEGEKTGYDCLKLVEAAYLDHRINHVMMMRVHSMNPVGVEKMTKVIKALELVMLRNHCGEEKEVEEK